MLLFLRDLWIEKTIHEQVYDVNGPWRRRQKTSFNGQMIEVLGRGEDGLFEVRVSDSRHFVDGILERGAVEAFAREIACEIDDVRGCYITVDEFHYRYDPCSRRFFMCVEKFTYCGGECDTYGDPTDINEVWFLRSLVGSALYAGFVACELVIHRSTIQDVCGEEGLLVMSLAEQNDDLCSDECAVCSGTADEGCKEEKSKEGWRVKRYHPFVQMDVDGEKGEGEQGRPWAGSARKVMDFCSDSEDERRFIAPGDVLGKGQSRP